MAADYFVLNDKTMAETQEQLDKILKEIEF